MADRLLYEGDGGRIQKVMPAPADTFLVGGNRLEWRKLDATSLPYTSRESGPIANVSMALDHLLVLINKATAVIGQLEADNRRIDDQQTQMLTALRMEVAELNRYFTETATKVTRASHEKVTVSIASNAALSIEPGRQVLTLNLSAAGSFDDSRAQLGVNSVQLALESLAAQNKQLAYQVAALQDAVLALQKKA